MIEERPKIRVFGRVRNNSNIEYTHITVTIDYFDADGNMVDTEDKLISSFKPGTIQSFKTWGTTAEGCHSYDICVSAYYE